MQQVPSAGAHFLRIHEAIRVIPTPEQLEEISRLHEGMLGSPESQAAREPREPREPGEPTRQPRQTVPFAALLLALSTHRRTVLVEVRRKQMSKRIFFEHGVPTDCRSNLVHETLGRYMVAQGKLAAEDLHSYLGQSASLGLPLGEVLLDHDVITAEELYRLLQANLAKKLLDIFTWRDGDFRTLSAVPHPESPLKVRVPQLVVTGIAKFAPQEEVDAGVVPLVGKKLCLHPNPPFGLDEIRLSPRQGQAAVALRSGWRIDELALGTGMPYEEITRLLYALAMLGVVIATDHPAARAAPAIATAASAPTAPIAPIAVAAPDAVVQAAPAAVAKAAPAAVVEAAQVGSAAPASAEPAPAAVPPDPATPMPPAAAPEPAAVTAGTGLPLPPAAAPPIAAGAPAAARPSPAASPGTAAAAAAGAQGAAGTARAATATKTEPAEALSPRAAPPAAASTGTLPVEPKTPQAAAPATTPTGPHPLETMSPQAAAPATAPTGPHPLAAMSPAAAARAIESRETTPAEATSPQLAASSAGSSGTTPGEPIPPPAAAPPASATRSRAAASTQPSAAPPAPVAASPAGKALRSEATATRPMPVLRAVSPPPPVPPFPEAPAPPVAAPAAGGPSVPPTPSAASAAAPAPSHAAAERRRNEIMQAYLSYRRLDSFDLLGADEDASPAAVEGRYLDFARRYAPWTLSGPDYAGMEEKARDLFLAGARAYAELLDLEQRNTVLFRRKAKREERDRRAPADLLAIKTDLLDPEVQYRKGRAQMDAGKFQEAALLLEFASDCDPQNGLYSAELAYCRFCLAPGQGARALKELQETLRRDPDCGLAVYYTGEIHRQMGEREEAEKMLRRAIKMMAPDRRPIDALKLLSAERRR